MQRYPPQTLSKIPNPNPRVCTEPQHLPRSEKENTMPNQDPIELNKLVHADNAHGTTDASQEIDATSLGITKRARWTHPMKLFLIELLKEHDVPGYRTHNACSQEQQGCSPLARSVIPIF